MSKHRLASGALRSVFFLSAWITGCSDAAPVRDDGSIPSVDAADDARAGCSANEDCARDRFCSAARWCVTGCRTDADCASGATCLVSTGECAGGGGATCTPACSGDTVCDDHQGAGEPACVARCTYGGCDSAQNCNLVTGLCEIAAPCDSSTAQPDVCSYGQYCAASDVCDYVPTASCPNVAGRTPRWDPSTSTGPVITRIWSTYFASDDTTNHCSVFSNTYTLAKVRMEAYRTTGTFPADESEFLSELSALGPDGTELAGDGRALAFDYVVTDDRKNVSVELYFCVPGSPSNWTLGLVFDGGNEACVTAP